MHNIFSIVVCKKGHGLCDQRTNLLSLVAARLNRVIKCISRIAWLKNLYIDERRYWSDWKNMKWSMGIYFQKKVTFTLKWTFVKQSLAPVFACRSAFPCRFVGVSKLWKHLKVRSYNEVSGQGVTEKWPLRRDRACY